MKKYIQLIQLFFLAGIFLLSLNACHDTHSHPEEAGAEEGNITFVTLTEEQIKAVDIRLGGFEKKNLKTMVKASGMLDLPPQNKASISSLVGGRITRINVIQGEFVKKGQTLAVIEHPDILKLQQDYLEAKSNFEFAVQEYQRQKELYDEKIVAGKKFQAAGAEYKSRRAMVTTLENQLLQIGISPKSVSGGSMIRSVSITTPIDGWIHQIEVNTGSYVEPAREIFVVVDNHHVHIDLHVFEKDITKVEEGQTVYFTLTNSPGQQYEAKIFAVGKAFENDTRSISVHADIKNNKNKNLLPGMYVDGRIEVEDSRTDALPDQALISEGNLRYIFVKADPASPSESGAAHNEAPHDGHKEHEGAEHITFKKVQVTTGTSDLGFTEVSPLEKLPANAQIVTNGAYFLAAQMKKGRDGDGHGH